MKTGFIHATVAAIGAIAGTNDNVLSMRVKIMAIIWDWQQIFNDIDGIWNPKEYQILNKTKITPNYICA